MAKKSTSLLDLITNPSKQYSPSNPAPYGQGAGVLTAANGGNLAYRNQNNTAVYNGDQDVSTSPTGGGGSDPVAAAAAAQAAANAAARARSQRENDATAAAVQHQIDLISGFGKSRDTKLGNIAEAYKSGDAQLLEAYAKALGGLEGNRRKNEHSEGDSSFAAVLNAIREVLSLSDQAASVGAGESDRVRAQMQALRNFTANKNEVAQNFQDTLQSINNSITSLNNDTSTSRNNLFNQAEADKEAAWANYNNQVSDAWTQISNIENANTNVDSDTSVGYQRQYADAGKKAQAAVSNAYNRQEAKGLNKWAGQGAAEERALTSSNRAASVNLGGKQKRPEGATLRRWEMGPVPA